jgi:hypothetical protein
MFTVFSDINCLFMYNIKSYCMQQVILCLCSGGIYAEDEDAQRRSKTVQDYSNRRGQKEQGLYEPSPDEQVFQEDETSQAEHSGGQDRPRQYKEALTIRLTH